MERRNDSVSSTTEIAESTKSNVRFNLSSNVIVMGVERDGVIGNNEDNGYVVAPPDPNAAVDVADGDVVVANNGNNMLVGREGW